MGKPRTKEPQKSKFGSHSTFSIEVARTKLNYELRLLRADNVVISTNVELRRDGAIPAPQFENVKGRIWNYMKNLSKRMNLIAQRIDGNTELLRDIITVREDLFYLAAWPLFMTEKLTKS